jgi:hypothetical protein
MEIMTIAKPKDIKPKDTKPADMSTLKRYRWTAFMQLMGFFLVLIILGNMHSCFVQSAADNEKERRTYAEEQRIRRTYDPTEKEMKEDIRSIAKRTYPNSYKDQVIFERNMKDLYGLD